MTITNNILDILDAMKGEGLIEAVQYNSPSKVNVELDSTDHPVAVLYIFRDGALDISTGFYREMADVNVMFLTLQDELDFQGSASETLVDAMAEVAVEFVSRLLDGGVVEFMSDEIAIKGVYDFNDKNTAGVSLQMKLREVQGHCL